MCQTVSDGPLGRSLSLFSEVLHLLPGYGGGGLGVAGGVPD